jgi:hypothetical protein
MRVLLLLQIPRISSVTGLDQQPNQFYSKPISNVLALKNLRGGDNYALA